jgi:uncharacterized protein YecE (DUF72 family)
MRLLTGTSGFAYPAWKGSFYPERIRPADMLAFYAARFPAVEINNTFYRMPAADTLRAWADQVPDGFTFVLKAPQRITHHKRLKEVGEEWEHFTRTAATLGARLGPILVQLPPNMKRDTERLHAFLTLTDPAQRVALEFRHASWLEPGVYDVLREHAAVLCIAHGEQEHTAPPMPTAGWGYARLRNVEYSDAELREWVERLRAQPWTECCAFFKHEDAGTGPRLAARLAALWEEL